MPPALGPTVGLDRAQSVRQENPAAQMELQCLAVVATRVDTGGNRYAKVSLGKSTIVQRIAIDDRRSTHLPSSFITVS